VQTRLLGGWRTIQTHESSRLRCEARRTRAVQPSGVGEAHECTQNEVGARAALAAQCPSEAGGKRP
jgi:hypothetical protein